MTLTVKNVFDKLLRDKSGRIVIWQNPNLPLWGWIVSVILGYMIKSGNVHSAIAQFGMATIFTWSYLEIRSGVNIFRRIIGIVVMLVVIYGLFRLG